MPADDAAQSPGLASNTWISRNADHIMRQRDGASGHARAEQLPIDQGADTEPAFRPDARKWKQDLDFR